MLGLRLIAICFFAVVVVTVPPKQFCARMDACSTESNYIGPQGLKGEPGAAGTFDYSPLEAMKTELKELKDIVAKANLTTSPGGSTSPAETDIDDCSTNSCLNGGTCVDGVDSFTCTCAPGYSDITCSTTSCTGYSYQSRCFVIYWDQELNYAASEAKCQVESGTLANIETTELYDNLMIYTRSELGGELGANEVFWIGATYAPNVGSHEVSWSGGSRTDFTGRWYPNYPKTVPKSGTDYASFVHIRIRVATDVASRYQGLINDPGRSYKIHYQLCEYTM